MSDNEDDQSFIMKKFIKQVHDTEDAAENDPQGFSKFFDLEFKLIRIENSDMKELPEFACSIGNDPENSSKNRYRDVLPYDYSRVCLKTDNGDENDYINASFINGANGKVSYIAAQGPLPETSETFWRMLIQYDVAIILMLCNLNEAGRSKCAPYWPSDPEVPVHFGQIQVSLLRTETPHAEYTLRYLEVIIPRDSCSTSAEDHSKRRLSGSETTDPISDTSRPVRRIIRQYQYINWPDRGSPDTVHPILDLLEDVRSVQPYDRRPLLVHCSAGVGRTGTFCALDYVRSLVKSGRLSSDFSVRNIVMELRRQRTAMVQTLEQYKLLYEAVVEMFVAQLELVDEHDYENLPLGENQYENLPLLDDHHYENLPEEEKHSIVELDATTTLSDVPTTVVLKPVEEEKIAQPAEKDSRQIHARKPDEKSVTLLKPVGPTETVVVQNASQPIEAVAVSKSATKPTDTAVIPNIVTNSTKTISQQKRGGVKPSIPVKPQSLSSKTQPLPSAEPKHTKSEVDINLLPVRSTQNSTVKVEEKASNNLTSQINDKSQVIAANEKEPVRPPKPVKLVRKDDNSVTPTRYLHGNLHSEPTGRTVYRPIGNMTVPDYPHGSTTKPRGPRDLPDQWVTHL